MEEEEDRREARKRCRPNEPNRPRGGGSTDLTSSGPHDERGKSTQSKAPTVVVGSKEMAYNHRSTHPDSRETMVHGGRWLSPSFCKQRAHPVASCLDRALVCCLWRRCCCWEKIHPWKHEHERSCEKWKTTHQLTSWETETGTQRVPARTVTSTVGTPCGAWRNRILCFYFQLRFKNRPNT